MKGYRNEEIRILSVTSRFAHFKRLHSRPTDRPTDQPTNQPMDMTSYRSARTHLKISLNDLVFDKRFWFKNVFDLRTFVIYKRSWSIYKCSWLTNVRDLQTFWALVNCVVRKTTKYFSRFCGIHVSRCHLSSKHTLNFLSLSLKRGFSLFSCGLATM